MDENEFRPLLGRRALEQTKQRIDELPINISVVAARVSHTHRWIDRVAGCGAIAIVGGKTCGLALLLGEVPEDALRAQEPRELFVIQRGLKVDHAPVPID